MQSCQREAINDRNALIVINATKQQHRKLSFFVKWVFVLLMMYSPVANAQFAVTTNAASGLAATYPSLAAAITALNAATITAPVVITCPTGTETAPVSGYVITATGTVSNTITIQGNGAANSIITAGLQLTDVKRDAILKIVGGDYITLQGFTFQENPGNTNTSANLNTMTEYGIGLWLSSATNGAQNNTIQNNIISLSPAFQNAIGIFTSSSSGHINQVLAATATSGTNSNNKFYGNTITNVAYGMYFICEPITATLFETGNDVGGTSLATGNTITFGNAIQSDLTTTRFSAVNPAGITFRNGTGNNVRFNTVTSNSLVYTQSGGLLGIAMIGGGTTPTGVTYTATMSDNIVNLTNSATTAIIGLDFGAGINTGTMAANSNAITLNQINTAASAGGITGIRAPFISATATFISNSITMNQSTTGTGVTSGGITGINNGAGSTTLTLQANTIVSNQTTSSTSAVTSGVSGIFANGISTVSNINNGNTVTIRQAVTGAGSYGAGNITFININGASGTINVVGNLMNTTGSSIRSTGLTRGIFQDQTVTTLVNIKDNVMNIDRSGNTGNVYFATTAVTAAEVADTISNNIITITGLTGNTIVTVISSLGGPASPAAGNKSICNNTINVSGTHTGVTIGITADLANAANIKGNSINISSAASTLTGITTSSTAATITGNTISMSSTSTSTGVMGGITAGSSVGTFNISNNNIGPLVFSGVSNSSGAILAISYTGAGSNVVNVIGNTISGVSMGAAGSTGAPTITAISLAGGILTVSKNTICGLSTLFVGPTSIVSGIRISNLSGNGSTVSNNRIANLSASASPNADGVRALNIAAAAANTTLGVYNNTVYLNASTTAATSGSSGLFVAANTTATTAVLDLRNNIIVNTSTPAGAGLTVAYRRNAGAAGNLANYSANSNRNLFYAGTPGANNLIYYDGTSTAQTIIAYKAGVFTAGTIAPRDANSVSENPPFLSTVCGNADFLKINTAIATVAESGGANIAAVTDDFEGEARNASTPDMGADEFSGTAIPNCAGTPGSANINAVASTLCSNTGTTLSLSTVYTDLGISYQWRKGTVSGGPYSTTLATNITQATGNLTTTSYFICEITCSFSGLTFTTPEKAIIVNPLPTVVATPASAIYCTTGTAVSITATGALTYTWLPATGLSATTGGTVLASPASSTTYTATGTDANGCINTATSIITVSTYPQGITAAATPAIICAGTTSQLTSAFTSPLVSTYSFAGSSGTYTTVTGTTLGADVIGNDVGIGNLPIGFNFNYNGNNFTVFGARSNGLIELGQASPLLSGFNTNALATTANCIAPLWDDNNTTGGSVIYTTTGTAPARVLTVQWTAMHVGGTGSASNSTINMQVKLFEGTNRIQFVYGTTSAAFTGTTASIGISGAVGNFASVTPGSPANNSNRSTTVENATISSATNFPSGTIYTFTPVAYTYLWTPSEAFLVTPTSQNTLTLPLGSTRVFTVTVTNGGCSVQATTTVTVSSGAFITVHPLPLARCAGQSASFSVTATGPGLTYQWRKGAVNIPIGGNASAGTPTLTLTNVSAADIASYDVVVSAACGSSATSNGAALSVTTTLAVISPSAATICIGESTTLTESGGNAASWSWAPGGETTQAITVSPTITTTYSVTTTLNSCPATTSQTITVNPKYTITASAGPNGSISPNGSTDICQGDNQSYSIIPATCYSIADVLVDGISVGAVSTYTFSNVTAAHSISATFVFNTYTITVNAGANGSVVPGTATVDCGTDNTYTITADPCYSIADVIVDGVSQGAVGTYTFTNVTANHTISATFVLNTYAITVTSGANGSITPGTASINCGSNATYTITADPCYSIADVVVDGISQGAIGSFTFTNVTATHTISASFSINTFNITVTPGANGAITPGTGPANCGDNVSYTITPSTCYHVDDVIVDGISQGAITAYTFNNVQAAHTISASFVINPPLVAPVISGVLNVCNFVGTGNPVTYTFNSTYAVSYSYILPPNVVLQGSTLNSITVTFLAGFATQPNKQIRVTALSPCGNSPMAICYLLTQAAGTPQPIVGSTNVCPVIGTAATITYTIPSVANATSYIWTAQAGTTSIIHSNGPGVNDTTVTVSFTNGFTSSAITVQATNDCGTSNARSLAIVRSNPATPGLITGPTNACAYMAPGGVPAVYSIVPVAGVTSYNWTVPPGSIGLTGQGSSSISFVYPGTFSSGIVTVTATNGCGSSSARSLPVGKLAAATPSVVDVIQVGFCPAREYTYTLAGIPNNSTSVQWTVPAGATLLSGQGSISISVSYPSGPVIGNITTQAFNNCSSSTIRTTPVKLPACPPVEPFAKNGAVATKASGMQVNIFPNPTVSDFNLQVSTTGKEKIQISITDMQGRGLKSVVVLPNQTTSIGSDLGAGAYIMEVKQGNLVKTVKIIKF